MRHVEWSMLWPTFALLALALIAVARVLATTATVMVARHERVEVQVLQQEVEVPRWSVTLPQPLPRAGEQGRVAAPAVTPQEQAAAGRRVIAGEIARALAQAASTGNTRAVEDLTRGLPRFGKAAREAIEEELGRVKDSKAKDALEGALMRLGS